jgi:hypothetical protein
MAVAIWAACAGAYVLGASNTNSCPSGSSKIGTAAACASAAAATVGLTYVGSATNLNSPSGCFHNIANPPFVVVFNDAVPGAADKFVQPLCAGARRPDPPRTRVGANMHVRACVRACMCVDIRMNACK